MTVPPSSMAPLRIAVFRRLWIALVIFSLGHLVQVVASSWLILELTGSPLWVSAMIGAPTLPLLVLSLPAGAAADLFDRRLILLVSSVVLAGASVTMSVLSLLDALTPARLVGLGLAIGCGVAFFNPTWHAIVPSLVPASLVPGAVSLNSASGGIATALGPAIGGLMLATVGAGFSFGVAAVGYLAVLVAIATTRTEELDQEKGSMVVAIATGIRYLRFSRDYLWLLLLGSLFGFASASLRAMLPNLTSDVLGGGSAMYGILLGLFGAGAMVGGLTRSQASGRIGPGFLPFCIAAFGVAGVAVGLSRWVPVTAVIITIAGVVWTWILATLNSTYQVLTPDWVRGRTMGAFILSVFGFMPLGAITSGVLGAAVGADSALVLFSIAVIVIGGLSFRMPIPVLEQIDPPVVLAPVAGTIPEVDDTDEAVLVITTWRVPDDQLNAFLEVLADLRRVRLRTGAYQWSAYRDATAPDSISEVFMLPSWEQRVQQIKRLDTVAMQVLRLADTLGSAETMVRRNLIGFDVDGELRRREPLEIPDYPDP
jgi:predicted MFS family arabinose efflux permease